MLSVLALATMPAFHRTTSVLLGQGAIMPSVDGNTIFAAEGQSCRAFDAKTLKPKWHQDLPFPVSSLKIVGEDLLVGARLQVRKAEARIYILDPRTGAIRWSIVRKATESPLEGSMITADQNRVYASLTPNGISAIDRKSHQPIWNHPFKKTEREFPESAAMVVDGTLLIYKGTDLMGLNAATGQQMWLRPKVYYFSPQMTSSPQIATANGIVWASEEQASEGLDLKTGKVRWSSPRTCSQGAIVVGDRLIGLDRGQASAIDSRTGRLAWSYEVGPSNMSGGSQFLARFGYDILAKGMSRTLAVTPEGKEQWSISNDASIDQPIWFESGHFVCFDSTRLLAYAPGATEPEPTEPSARQALAARLTADFANLDAEGVKRLAALGDDAFEPVFKAFLATCEEHDRNENATNSYALYSRFHDLAQVLEKMVSSGRTDELLGALNTLPAKSSARPFVLGYLARMGDQDKVVPYFLKELKATTPDFEMYESSTYVAREAIIRSSHPAAIAFLIEKLKDPKADPVLREAAYSHLAGTGGEAGVKAILAERHSRKLLPPLASRLDLGDVGKSSRDRKATTLIAEKSDGQGHTWALAQCAVLGSSGDLWLLEKTGNSWGNPLFTGVSLDGISRWAKTKDPSPKAFGKSADELAKGAWYPLLVSHHADLARDTDGDGLTDLVEARLGTDPKKADTDGDGDRDEIDPFPNAPTRPLSDTEKVLAAVFEARYHFMAWPVAAVFTAPPDLKPFEMVGYPGPVIWNPIETTRFSTSLERCYEQGVAFIAMRGNDQKGETALTWNANHTEASLTISTYYGGLNGTGYSAVVRKFGNEWLVVSLDQAYVS